MLQDFKKFVTKGNVLDLAVAVIIGIAFGLLVNSFVKDIVMPIVGAVFGKPTFDDLTLGIGDGVIRYGSFLTLLVNFLIIAFVLFVIVQAAEKLQNLRSQADKEEDPSEVDLLVEIRDLLRTQRGA